MQNDVDGRAYYTFEFTAQAPNYTRHALGAIVIANGMICHPWSSPSVRCDILYYPGPCGNWKNCSNAVTGHCHLLFSTNCEWDAAGKFYTLTTGANERRWEKMKDRLHTVVDSFKIENRIWVPELLCCFSFVDSLFLTELQCWDFSVVSIGIVDYAVQFHFEMFVTWLEQHLFVIYVYNNNILFGSRY